MSDIVDFLEDAELFSDELFDKVASRQKLHAGINPGGWDIQVGRVLDAIRQHHWLQPVRSGRMGNWGPIWSGRSPLLAYNRAVTVDLTVARPVVHSMGLTETADLTAGDTIYRPGSLYQSGTLQPMVLTSPLAGWQDLDPTVPRFVPWTWGRTSVGPVNLVQLHGEPLRAQAPVPVLDEGDLLWQHSGLVRQWLTRLFEHAAGGSAGGDITWLFARGVHRDATVGPIRIRRDGSIFTLSADDGKTWEKIGAAAQLADRCLLPYRVVAQADDAERLLRSAPEITPLLSNRLSKAIMGYLGASSEDQPDPYSQPYPFALLVEWGALTQGGYPPVRAGQFSGKGNQQLSRLTVTALAEANDLPPLVHVMLPLAPIILMPSTAEPLDVAWLSPFFQRLHTLTEGTGGDTEHALSQAATAYREWTRGEAVSAFYRGKFSGVRSVAPHGQSQVSAQTIEQVEVRALTLRQASLAVATLFSAWTGD